MSGYIRTALQWEIHAALAEWAIRSLLMEIPEPEIYYPAGVELTLSLTEPVALAAPHYSEAFEQEAARQFTDDQREELSRIVAVMPYRTKVPVSGRSSDFTNVLFIGTHDHIVTAFNAAGWTPPSASSFRDRVHWIRAVAELRGDDDAPMSLLLLNGAEPNMSWEKGLNDVSKRHHIRMWKAAGTWRGQEIWVGAATRDVDFAYLRPGRKLAHKIEEDVDHERDKVAYDVAFSSCGRILDWSERPDFPRVTGNATGDLIVTDGHMVVIAMNDCPAPRMSTDTVNSTPLAEHGGTLQRLARREILSFRNGLLRTNRYWRTFEASRWIVQSIRRRNKQHTPDPELLRAHTLPPLQ